MRKQAPVHSCHRPVRRFVRFVRTWISILRQCDRYFPKHDDTISVPRIILFEMSHQRYVPAVYV